jgi:hypothetical protein
VPSFTIAHPDLQGMGPVVDVGLSVSLALEDQLRRAGESLPQPIQLQSMIDTGATGSVIQQGLAAELGLKPIGVTLINTPSSTNVECYEYAVRFVSRIMW